MSISLTLKQLCHRSIVQAFLNKIPLFEASEIDLTESTQEKFGHYQLNNAMKLSKILGTNPRQIAEEIVQNLNLLPETKDLCAKIDIAGPGFINFTLNPQYIAQKLQTQLQDPRLGVPLPKSPLKVIIDFSSPNIAKEMHVGHLRSTIIGDCLARILSFMGHEVLRLNHIGDWGTQFGMLIAHLKTTNPEIMGDAVPNLSLGTLAAAYRKAKERFDQDPNFKKEAQLEVVALQQGGEVQHRAWKHLCTISRHAYQTIYDLLDIDLIERGESFYNPFLGPLIQELEQKDLVTLSMGAKCMILDGFTNREGENLPLILQKNDGGFNYATTDMAALKHRIQVEKGNWLIYVTDAGQALHFQMIFEAGKKAEFYKSNQVRLDHVPFGLVLKADGKKFQTRSGETERLIDLLDKAIQLAKEKLQEHNPNMTPEELEASAKILGINAVKYADLSSHRLSDYIFSYDKMLKFEGNTAAFILYAYVRIRSIQRKVNIDLVELLRQNGEIRLVEPIETSLGLMACQFTDVLISISKELLPNRLTDYLYRLAEKFHGFFHQCRVEGSENETSRLLLCEAVAQVLNQGIQLLGLKPLNKM